MSSVDAPPDVATVESEQRGPSVRTANWPRRAFIGLLFLGLVLLMLRPTPHSLANTFSPDLGDPALVTWIMAWDSHALFTDPFHLFDANIYWPNDLTLAYTDSLVVLAPAFALLRVFGAGAVLAFNLLLLSLVLLAATGAYSLTRWLTARTDVSIIAGIAFGFSAYTFGQIGHLQLLLLGFFPIAFLMLFRLLEERTTWCAVAFGLMNVAFVLGTLTYAAVYAVCTLVMVTGYLVARRFHPGPGLARTLLVAGSITIVSLPFLWPYFQLGVDRGFIPEPGLKAADVVTPAPGSFVYGDLDAAAAGTAHRQEHTLFPGFVTLALAALGLGVLVLLTVRRRRMPPGDDRDHALVPEGRGLYLWLLVAAGVASVVLALGPEVMGVTMPLQLLRDFVPGFSTVRVATRFAVPGLLTLAVLAAVGLAWIISRWSRTIALLTTVSVGGLLLLELAAPLERVDMRTDEDTIAVYEALDKKPHGAVVELPVIFPGATGSEWAFVEAPRMVYSTHDWKPRFNGYSGGTPDEYFQNGAELNLFPSRAALGVMRRLEIRYAILHVGTYEGVPQFTEEQGDAVISSLPPGTRAERHGKDWLVDLAPS